MAYALQLPRGVTDLIYSMRDWRWEMAKNGGKTPSASCFNVVPFHPPIESEFFRLRPIVASEWIPEYYIDSSDGEIQGGNDSSNAAVMVYHPGAGRCDAPARVLTLRKWLGKSPVKFRRLQKKRVKHTHAMWWQCEPCE